MALENAPMDVVLAWLAAVNEGDAIRALALSAPDVEVVGPKGTGHGKEELKDWLEKAGAIFATHRIFCSGDAVVVAQRGIWRSRETGAVIGEADVATRFKVADGRVAQLERYESLDDALRGAELTEANEAAGKM